MAALAKGEGVLDVIISDGNRFADISQDYLRALGGRVGRCGIRHRRIPLFLQGASHRRDVSALAVAVIDRLKGNPTTLFDLSRRGSCYCQVSPSTFNWTATEFTVLKHCFDMVMRPMMDDGVQRDAQNI
jgi:hypothetical protein